MKITRTFPWWKIWKWKNYLKAKNLFIKTITPQVEVEINKVLEDVEILGEGLMVKIL